MLARSRVSGERLLSLARARHGQLDIRSESPEMAEIRQQLTMR
jgi:hypothetical protein